MREKKVFKTEIAKFLGEKSQKFCDRFLLRLPIIQGGMVWASGAKLAAACANQGIIGTIGAGSMNLELLEQQIQKAQQLCDGELARARLAVNFPLLFHQIDQQIEIAMKGGIKIFITSAGSPKIHTQKIKQRGGTVIHVISHPSLAQKCEAAGVDMVVAEGFEAGGHNGREELTTMVLVPQTVDQVKIPVVAAGGIMDARGIAAAHMLGACAVQMGTRFLLSTESSAHQRFKEVALTTSVGNTRLILKKHVPVRMLKNSFCQTIEDLESSGASLEELVAKLGKGRAKKGIFEGDLIDGELEIGQGHSMIKKIQSCEEIIDEIEQQLLELADYTQ
ncbi:MAG: nitronate monooxygenase [Bacteriovoracaceae bacterium]|nr:nitronate monooxygenase [Bacteriovoracaceae bacterium]